MLFFPFIFFLFGMMELCGVMIIWGGGGSFWILFFSC